VHEPRRRHVASRSSAAARPLEHFQANSAEIQHAAATTGVGVCAGRRRNRPELPVEVAEALELVRRERDVLDLGNRRAERIARHVNPFWLDVFLSLSPRECRRGEARYLTDEPWENP
jgi:hypothetical protein